MSRLDKLHLQLDKLRWHSERTMTSQLDIDSPLNPAINNSKKYFHYSSFQAAPKAALDSKPGGINFAVGGPSPVDVSDSPRIVLELWRACGLPNWFPECNCTFTRCKVATSSYHAILLPRICGVLKSDFAWILWPKMRYEGSFPRENFVTPRHPDGTTFFNG